MSRIAFQPKCLLPAVKGFERNASRDSADLIKGEFQLNNCGVKLAPLATQKADGSRKLKYFPLQKRYATHLRNTETRSSEEVGSENRN